eukprot:7378712-Prymnesium_polylepis.1
MTVDELRHWILNDVGFGRSHDALPTYLLDRNSSAHLRSEWMVVCLPGEVRDHVSDSELMDWAARLERRSAVHLQVLRCKCRECLPTAEEHSYTAVFLDRKEHLRTTAKQEWLDDHKAAEHLTRN